MTTVWACEKTVVMLKQPGHFTSMKKERGAGTRVYRCVVREAETLETVDYLELVLSGFSGGSGVKEIFS